LITNCIDDNDCTDESACIRFDRFETFCLLRCDSDSDCRSGYVCRQDIGTTSFCYVEPNEFETPFSAADASSPAPEADATSASPSDAFISPADATSSDDATDDGGGDGVDPDASSMDVSPAPDASP